jgi:hypothetical protein
MVLVPELAIGEMEGSSAHVFGSVPGLDVDAGGRILVIDGQAREVRVFSATGEHVRTFGGPGDGPGEFRGPDHVRIASDGRIVVRDQLGARFSVFSAEGDYIAGWPRASGFSTSTRFFLDADERVANPTFRDRLVSYDLDGTPRDTVPIPTRGFTAPRLDVVLEGGSASYSIPFMPGEQWTMTRDGRVVFGITDRYAFERWEDDGRVLRIERRAEAVPVAAGEATQAREETTRRIRRVNDPAWRWQGPEVPLTKPLFQSLLTGVDGTIWVFRESHSIEEENPAWNAEEPGVGFPTRWRRPVVADVFDEDGRYLGPVKIPESLNWSFPPAIVSREWVLGAALHESGYPQVVRFRVEPR